MISNVLTASDWIHLRTAVIVLGENYGWWPSKILTGHGEEFLSFILPKTKTFAAFQLGTEIARLEHDRNVGPGRYHIFRLTQKLEEQIFINLKNVVVDLKILLENEMMHQLFEMSSGIAVSPAVGPLLIGHHNELNDTIVFQSIARHYYEAFKNNYKSYPYLN
jgi:hypothetical protein